MLEQDKHTARVVAQTFGAELERLGRGRVTPSAWLDEPGAQWPVDPTVGNHPIAGYHHLGGTRMGSDPATSVVDADCAVHGYANLHIAGSSTFATAGWANPTLTIRRAGAPARRQIARAAGAGIAAGRFRFPYVRISLSRPPAAPDRAADGGICQ